MACPPRRRRRAPDERKGETKAESDRDLGKSIVTHWLTLCRSPAGTMAGSRQKNAAGVKYSRGACPNIAAASILPPENSGQPRFARHAIAGLSPPIIPARKPDPHQRPS